MHVYGFPNRFFPFDLELLYGLREERFPLEALADFARLCTWVTSPDEPLRIERAAKAAVARVVRELLRERDAQAVSDNELERHLEQVQRAHFSLKTVTFGLLVPFGTGNEIGRHEDLFLRADTACVIAETLLQFDRHAPQGIRPSVNRALQQASFPNAYSTGVSRQTARDIWDLLAPASGFLLCQRWLYPDGFYDDDGDEANSIIFIPAETAGFQGAFLKFQETGFLRRLLSSVKYLQQELTRVLDVTGAAPVQFVEFPDSIPAVEVEIPAFTREALRRVLEYSAAE